VLARLGDGIHHGGRRSLALYIGNRWAPPTGTWSWDLSAAEEVPFAVLPYDPEWPHQFALERELLDSVLAPWLVAGVHHIGSTAVPGISGKPVIDMIAGVRNQPQAQAAIEPLRAEGYVHAPHRADALWFAKPPTDTPWGHTHHLHLTEPGSGLWQERLAFRDALRADPELVAEYERLKRSMDTEPDGSNYTATSKRSFVVRVLADAGITLAP
jgi:GrpB-like predicted nucleotidyltransferase (UPF0157 family)